MMKLSQYNNRMFHNNIKVKPSNKELNNHHNKILKIKPILLKLPKLINKNPNNLYNSSNKFKIQPNNLTHKFKVNRQKHKHPKINSIKLNHQCNQIFNHKDNNNNNNQVKNPNRIQLNHKIHLNHNIHLNHKIYPNNKSNQVNKSIRQ